MFICFYIRIFINHVQINFKKLKASHALKSWKFWLNYGRTWKWNSGLELSGHFHVWIGYSHRGTELISLCILIQGLGMSRRSSVFRWELWWRKRRVPLVGGRKSFSLPLIFWKHDSSISPNGPHLYCQHLAHNKDPTYNHGTN